MADTEVGDIPSNPEPAVPTNPNHIPGDRQFDNGALVAQAALLFMAMLPIYFGSISAINALKKRQEKIAKGEKVEKSDVETISSKDAMKFPLTASIALFSLYLITKNIDPKYLNYLLSAYFMILGVAAITVMFSEIEGLRKFFPDNIFNADTFNMDFHSINKKSGEKEEYLVGSFTYIEIFYFFASLAIGVWYVYSKHWLANNIFGLAFSMNAIKLLQIGSFQTGVILLSGLFFYDVFWVFGTEVMVTVAKNIDAPIKILFPTDFLENHIFGAKHSMLGLGDIVLPGILIALYARFDWHLHVEYKTKQAKNTYFHTGLISYFAGLVITMVVMNVFRHAQPALLYLVPSCVLIPILVAVVNGQFKDLWAFNDEEEKEEEKEEEEKKDK